MKFVITGNPITKKNSQQILVNRKTGKPFISPSSKYKAYEKEAVKQLLLQNVRGYSEFDFPIDTPVNVACVYFMETKRKVDLANLLEASNDILVAAGILADDNCSIASMYDGSEVHHDKQNPRVEIEITPIVGGEGWPYQ